jgi:hypothetical protein
VAWGAKDNNLRQSITLGKKGSRTITTFGLDWSEALEVIEFNDKKLEGCTKIGIIASSSKKLQRSIMNAS